MTTSSTVQLSAYERSLLEIVRTLPPERIIQILDFARYIQSQTLTDFVPPDEEEDEETILADEARWDALFAATQEGLNKMAERVRAEIRAGRSKPMVFKNNRLAPG